MQPFGRRDPRSRPTHPTAVPRVPRRDRDDVPAAREGWWEVAGGPHGRGVRVAAGWCQEHGPRTTLADSLAAAVARAAGRKLNVSPFRFRRLVEFSPNGIFIHVGGRFLYANNGMAHILGYADTPAAHSLIGTAGEVEAGLAALKEVGVAYVLLFGQGSRDNLRRFAERVMPKFGAPPAP